MPPSTAKGWKKRGAALVAGSAVAAMLGGVAEAAAAPTPIFLWYADGGPAPSEGDPCVAQTPPKYTCSFAATPLDCMRKIQEHLDAWYAAFNVVFTFRRPAKGAYYTVVITSSGGWCGQNSSVGGVAPIDCQDMRGGTAYAFSCAYDPKSCATVIAQEHAHMVGLGHTASRNDAMYPIIQPTSDGFEDRLNDISGEQCRVTQNSFQMLLARLGAWAGGPKPDPFAEFDASGSPTSPDAGAPRGSGGVSSGLAARPSPPSSADAGSSEPGVFPGTPVTRLAPDGGFEPFEPFVSTPSGGCSVAPSGRPLAPLATFALLIMAGLALVSRRLARQRARRRVNQDRGASRRR